MAALVPKPQVNLIRFHGVFARSVPRAGDEGQAGQRRSAC
ncbi:MAG: hypothetical protein IPF57_14605 [Gammaproteobacteria bacterium]|nr:hypothetical protein [Gammaproteobacteria bacterium]